jgi:predicted TPR repeat methyltransferase
MQRQDRVQWVYAAENNEQLADRYDQWAEDYDSDLKDVFDWRSPELTAEFLAKYVSRESRVLDAGAGTGLVGQALASLGYENLEAMDMSPGMLDQARKKGVYKDLHQMVMGDTLAFATGAFDAVIAVGVLTLGHAPASSLDELARITKAGGYVIFALRTDLYENGQFKEKQDGLAAEGRWRLVEASEEFQPLPKGEPEVMHRVWVYHVTGAR